MEIRVDKSHPARPVMTKAIRRGNDLKRMLKENSPLAVYPFGFDEHTPILIGQGFLYPDAVYFLDPSWNAKDPPAHFPGHILPGKVSQPYWHSDYGVVWGVGKARIIKPRGRLLLEAYKNQKQAARLREDPARSRKAARKIADREIKNWRKHSKE